VAGVDPDFPTSERPIGPVRGTRDWLPADSERRSALEATLLDRFARAGYAPIQTPVLEPTELHERKSGAAIVSKLFELAGVGPARVCLRPELTAGIVRAFTDAPDPPPLPWRVGHSGTVFRHETPRPGRLREFRQVGVELIGASGPDADGEVLWLADRALADAGVADATIRVGHVGLILEMLRRSGLPDSARAGLLESLGLAASDGRDVLALEHGLEQLANWLQGHEPGPGPLPPVADGSGDAGDDRLFRTLVPVVTGRRSGAEVLQRLRRKWELGHSLASALERVRGQLHALAGLRGRPAAILDRLARDHEVTAPESVAQLRRTVQSLDDYGVDLDRVELDLGFGRGIGFYTQLVFELVAPTANGPVVVCGGGRYDGLARVFGSDRDDRGVGFAFGLERLLGVLDARGTVRPGLPPRGCLVAASSGHSGEATRLASRLRAEDDGRWVDGGPIVVAFDWTLPEAQRHARAVGLAAVIRVDGESALGTRFDRTGDGWAEARAGRPGGLR